MSNKPFSGIIPAIFSVYDEDLKVKKDTVKKLVNYQLDNGSTGFYVGGNTGECTVLPAQIRKDMLSAVLDANGGRGKIMAHIGAGHLDETLDLLKDANEKGVDAVASLPPSLTRYYNIDETLEYYKILAGESKSPVYAYVTPVLNGNLVDFAKKVLEIDNVAGIKISIPDYYMFGKVTAIKESANILNGPDETLICGLAEGADGGIGTSYNMCPALAVALYNAFNAGDIKKARELQRRLNSVIDIPLGRNLAYWKAVMTCMGFDMGYTLRPQQLPTEEELAILKAKLKATGEIETV